MYLSVLLLLAFIQDYFWYHRLLSVYFISKGYMQTTCIDHIYDNSDTQFKPQNQFDPVIDVAGYLACALFLDESNELVMLLINTIQKVSVTVQPCFK